MANQYKNKIIYNGTTLMDISDTTAVAADVASGKYFYTANGTKTAGTASGSSGSSGQTVTGTVMGNGTNVLEISCTFEPDLIYVHSDLSDDATKRGVVLITIIKDRLIDMHNDPSTSAASESMYYISHNVTGYNESDTSNPHASYSNGILTITSINSSATRFLSGQVYNYELSTIGTGGSSTPSATSHSIYFEFSDGTNTTLTYYDNEGTFINSAVTATTPTTYGGKTVTLAQLDGVTWYEVSSDIPLNTELVDYNAVRAGYRVGDSGAIEAGESWECVTDYIPIDSSMIFTFKMLDWYALGLYDANKNVVQAYRSHDIADSTGNGVATGTLNSSRIPSTAKYVVLAGNPYNLSSNTLSLIRTA